MAEKLEPEVLEAIQAQEQAIVPYEALRGALVIASQLDYDRAGDLVVEVGGMAKRIEDARVQHKAPHLAKCCQIDTMYKAILDRLVAVTTHYYAKRQAWRVEQEKLRVEAHRKALEEARKEQARLEAAALAKAAKLEAKGEIAKAEAVLEAVPEVVVPRPVDVPIVEKTAGMALVTVWTVKVLSKAGLVTAAASGEIDLESLLVNEAWLKKNAQALKRHAFLDVTSAEVDRRTGR